MSAFRHHKYTWTKSFSYVSHRWELVCADGAIHFHATISPEGQASCGLEFHHLKGEGAPDHVNCPLTGGRCWHDGTSLYASETVWPSIEPYLARGEHEQIFKTLEYEARIHFERMEKADG